MITRRTLRAAIASEPHSAEPRGPCCPVESVRSVPFLNPKFEPLIIWAAKTVPTCEPWAIHMPRAETSAATAQAIVSAAALAGLSNHQSQQHDLVREFRLWRARQSASHQHSSSRLKRTPLLPQACPECECPVPCLLVTVPTCEHLASACSEGLEGPCLSSPTSAHRWVRR